MRAKSIIVVEEFKKIVDAVNNMVLADLQAVSPTITGVHYLHGHPADIKKRLQGKASAANTKFRRYPLVALLQDFAETTGADGRVTCTLQLIIAYQTTEDKYAEDRYTSIFKPILYPIYNAIKEALAASAVFTNVNDPDALLHDKIDRLLWGKLAGNNTDGYIFSDVLDAIEVRNLKVVLDPLYCTSTVNKILKL